MSATAWLVIAIVGFSLSGIALATAVFMFIKMNIPAVIGDLTGKTVAREIRAMRESNALSGNKLHKSSRVNIERGKLTDKVAEDEPKNVSMARTSKRLDKAIDSNVKKKNTTESFSKNVEEVNVEERRATAVLQQNRTTDILEEEKTYNVSAQRETAVLSEPRQTEVLNEMPVDKQAGTSVLIETRETQQQRVKPVSFTVTRSVIKIHTNESI